MIVAALAAAVLAGPLAVPPTAERTPNLYRQPAHCRAIVDREVARQAVALRGLPPAVQYAVVRNLDGCSVPTPVGYHPGYLLPGEADAPVTREDAPSNRR
jgi:predicted small lipoprotein YifL